MFKIKEVKEIKFSKAQYVTKVGLGCYFEDIKTKYIPFFWDLSADTILINTECKLYPIALVYIDKIVSCDDIEEQLNYDLAEVQKSIGTNDLEKILSVVKLFYEIEKIRRGFILNRL